MTTVYHSIHIPLPPPTKKKKNYPIVKAAKNRSVCHLSHTGCPDSDRKLEALSPEPQPKKKHSFSGQFQTMNSITNSFVGPI